MIDAATSMQEDLNAAKYLLNKHGFAFKIYGRDDVHRVILDNYGSLPERNVESIIKHVMEGEDWPTMSDHTNDDENNLIALVSGTQNDHPEWFQNRQDFLEEKTREWIYSHGQAVLDDMEEDIVKELGVGHLDAVEIIELIERAEINIKF